MIFPFRPYTVMPSSAYSFDVIYRPVVPVRIGVGSGLRVPFYALLDTGADDSRLTTLQAERLGIVPDRSRPVIFRSATGLAAGSFGEVTIELRRPPVSYVWTAKVAIFPDSEEAEDEDQYRIVLGHTSFFRYFSVAFDFQRNRLKIRPNRLFVGQPR